MTGGRRNQRPRVRKGGGPAADQAKEGRSLRRIDCFKLALVAALVAMSAGPVVLAQAQEASVTPRQRVEARMGAMADGDRVDPYPSQPSPQTRAQEPTPKRVIGGHRHLLKATPVADGQQPGGQGAAGAEGAAGAAGASSGGLFSGRGSPASGIGGIGGGGGGLLGTLGALGAVIALIFGVRVLWARLGGGVVAGGGSPVVEVLSRTSIGARNNVLLLRVGPRVLVVSETAQGTRTLSEFDDAEAVAELLTRVESAKAESVSGGFREAMSQINRQYNPLLHEAADEDAEGSSLSHLLSKVRRMNRSQDVAAGEAGGRL